MLLSAAKDTLAGGLVLTFCTPGHGLLRKLLVAPTGHFR